MPHAAARGTRCGGRRAFTSRRFRHRSRTYRRDSSSAEVRQAACRRCRIQRLSDRISVGAGCRAPPLWLLERGELVRPSEARQLRSGHRGRRFFASSCSPSSTSILREQGPRLSPPVFWSPCRRPGLYLEAEALGARGTGIAMFL